VSSEDPTLTQELAAFRLILDTIYVVGRPPRGSDQQLQRLSDLDPAAAQQIAGEYDGA
jgi:hypothetical protein